MKDTLLLTFFRHDLSKNTEAPEYKIAKANLTKEKEPRAQQEYFT